MSSRPISDEEAVAAADKEMEERANRAKELLSQRYVGLKRQQVCQSSDDDDNDGDELISFLEVQVSLLCAHLFFGQSSVFIGSQTGPKNATRTRNDWHGRRQKAAAP